MFGLLSLHPPDTQSAADSTPDVEYVTLFPNIRASANHAHTFSIIAIHGFMGHPINTWSHGNTLWLRDLLPKQLSTLKLRVSSFGYNSALFGRSLSQIRHYAEQLLMCLRQLRRDIWEALSRECIRR